MRSVRGSPAVHACQISSARVGPHHFAGTPRRRIGTVRSNAGGGQALRHRFPSNAANGTMTPSRLSTPTPNAPLGESAAPWAAPSASTTTPAAMARTVFIVTDAEYTPRSRGRRAHDAGRTAAGNRPTVLGDLAAPRRRGGRKAIEDASRAFFTSFPDATLEIDAVLVDPPRVAIFTTVNATHVNEFFGMPGTNRRLEFRIARLLEVNDQGLIAHERRIYDFTGVLVQIGVLRAKPAKPQG